MQAYPDAPVNRRVIASALVDPGRGPVLRSGAPDRGARSEPFLAGDPLRVGEVAVERGLEVLDECVHPVMVALHRVLAARHDLERSVELREIGGFDEHLELAAVPETELAA